MRGRCSGVVLALCMASARCGSDGSGGPTAPSAPSAFGVQVVGRVFDERAARGVGGVTLTWTPEGAVETTTTGVTVVTDSTGGYALHLTDPGPYVVAGGSAGITGLVRLAGTLDLVNFYVNTGGCPTVYGRIVDAMTRRPVSDAQVGWAGITSTTGITGEYRLTFECGRSPGANTTIVSVTHPNYVTYTGNAGPTESLGLNPSESRADISVTPR